MTNSISQQIDSYAKAHLKELKQEEAKTGKKLTKYDIAQKMLSSGKLSKNDFASWMGTNEGYMSQQQSQVSIFSSPSPFTESYLETMTDTIEICGLKYEDTPQNRALQKQAETNMKKLNAFANEHFTSGTESSEAERAEAAKGIQASGKLAPVLGGAMQSYFGVEGTILMADGTEKIVNAETKEDVRTGGSEVGMGAIMVGGAVGSVRSGAKGRKANQEQAKFDNMAKEAVNDPFPSTIKGGQNIVLSPLKL